MNSNPSLNPELLARNARASLRKAARYWPPRLATMFFKPWEKVYTLGIATPQLRRLLSQLHRSVRQSWGFAKALRFAEIMLAEKSIEGRMLGIELLGRFHRVFEAALLVRAHRWLHQDRCDNWALTDDLCASVLAPLFRRHPRLVPALRQWARSDNQWVRRAAAVSLVPLARRGEQLDAAYRIAMALLRDRAALIHKATGWLLREAGKTDPARLEAHLLAQGPNVPRTALRYAIERFPQQKRRNLLQRTKMKDPTD